MLSCNAESHVFSDYHGRILMGWTLFWMLYAGPGILGSVRSMLLEHLAGYPISRVCFSGGVRF